MLPPIDCMTQTYTYTLEKAAHMKGHCRPCTFLVVQEGAVVEGAGAEVHARDLPIAAPAPQCLGRLSQGRLSQGQAPKTTLSYRGTS